MHSAFSKPIPHFNALGITAILAIVGAVVFAAWSNGVDATAYNGVDSDALELKAGLGAWAGLFLLVSIPLTRLVDAWSARQGWRGQLRGVSGAGVLR